jgi:hypothetical protein
MTNKQALITIGAPSRISHSSHNALHTPSLQIVRSISATRSLARDDRPKSTKGLKPKILSENPPPLEEQSEEVKQHNKEMDERAERAETKIGVEDAYKDKESDKPSANKVPSKSVGVEDEYKDKESDK